MPTGIGLGISPVLGGAASAPTVINRNPLATDDSTKGYAVGDTWLNVSTGAMYNATGVSSGAANWTLLSSPGLALDAVGGAVAAYGITKLRAAYAGNAFRVRRASDNAEQDIGFDANGLANWSAVTSFGASTTVFLKTWYDQSGNGNDATQTTAASQPPVFNTNTIGTKTALDWTAGLFLAMPAGVAGDKQALTVVGAMRPRGSHTSIFFTMPSAGTGTLMGWFDDGNLEQFDGTHDSGPGKWHVSEGVGAGIWNASNNRRFCDDRFFDTGTAGAAGALTGGFIPRSTGVLDGYYGALVIYGSILTSTQVQSIARCLYLAHGIAPQIRDRLIWCGDSITYGIGTTANAGYAQLVKPTLSRPYQFCNLGVPSQLQASESASTYTAFKVTGAKNVCHVFSGTNDIAANGTAAALEPITSALCTAIKSGGINKLIVATMLPRNGGFSAGQDANGFETQRQLYNTWLRANYLSFADALADYGGDATMGPQAAASNVSLYADGIHPSQTGHVILAGICAPIINAFG